MYVNLPPKPGMFGPMYSNVYSALSAKQPDYTAPIDPGLPSSTTGLWPGQRSRYTVDSSGKRVWATPEYSMSTANRNDQPQRTQTDIYKRLFGQQTDSATNQMTARWNAATNTLAQQASSPFLSSLMSQAMANVRNPGISKSALDAMKGSYLATSAANQAAASRKAQWTMAGQGMSGASREFILNSMRNSAGANAARGVADIDAQAAQFAAQNRNSALSQAAGLFNQQSGLKSQYANFLTQYDPLNWMQRIQGMSSPFGQYGSASVQSAAAPGHANDVISQLRQMLSQYQDNTIIF